MSGNDFKIDDRLGALTAMLRGVEPFPVSLNLTSSGFESSVSGTVQDFLDGEGLKLHLSAEANELSNLFKLLQMDSLPLARVIKVRSNAAGVFIDEARFGTADGKRLVLQAQGKLTNLSASPEADLQFVATVPDPAVEGSMVGVLLPSLLALLVGAVCNKPEKLSHI
ncbi:MAG: hypothetical protein AB1Z29_14315 [Desulfobacterales bacterium]